MNSRRSVTWVASLLLLASLLVSVMCLRRVDRLRAGATLEEVLYITSPQTLKRFSLGYDGLLADIYWTRAVQYFGRKHNVDSDRYDLLAPLLEITTALDPHLLVAYQFGANFLAPRPPSGGGMPDKAIELTEFGIRNNPDDWNLYYQLGFIYYMEKKDYPNAAKAFERGSRVPNAHPFLRILAAQMAQHAGELEMARMLWVTTFQSTHDKQIRANAYNHLLALKVDEDVTHLENAVTQYGQKTGNLPPSISAMVAAGLLPEVPLDPDGNPYKLMPDGRIEVGSPQNFSFIERGVPPGYKPPRPKFRQPPD